MRYLEYNDVGGGNHNQEAIPALLAVSERGGKSGAEFLAAMILSYEIGSRVVQSVPGASAGWDKHGWSTDARAGINMPAALGRPMELTEVQIAHAIAICASRGVPLGILDADREENSMAKNLRFGFMAREAQGHVHATIDIVVENDLAPSDIERVLIKAGAREARHTTALPKKFPRNAETADHSAYYANAFAIKYRSFGPESANSVHFTDPEIVNLIERIMVVNDPELPARGREGISEIYTRDGRKFSKRRNALVEAMSDTELEAKFMEMALKEMDESRATAITEVIWNFENTPDVRALTKLMSFGLSTT